MKLKPELRKWSKKRIPCATHVFLGIYDKLSRCEVFVFGSAKERRYLPNFEGAYAFQEFDADPKIKEGPTGQCYAIPITDSVEEMKPYVDRFIQYVKGHPYNRFLLNRIGCTFDDWYNYESLIKCADDGNLDSITDDEIDELFSNAPCRYYEDELFNDEQIAPLFDELYFARNVVFPFKWMSVLGRFHHGEHKRERPIAPEVITEETLQDLCRQYRYEISIRDIQGVPNINIRYVKGENEFGYTGLYNIFFEGPEMYVFDEDERWRKHHKQHKVLRVFNDECRGRGYAHRVLFAGVRTPFRDAKGNYIYTGDVVKANNNNMLIFPVGVICGYYAFVLDMHHLALSECDHLLRLGTVFYKLKKDERPPTPLPRRNFRFLSDEHGSYGYNGDPKLAMIKAQHTPSFMQDDLDYEVAHVCEKELKNKPYHWWK
ncbi:MAG: hypothetical protein IJU90_04040 [Bacteroidales bacterium]|nr:hypothetical protein [Bacteroidales bacterium]